MRYKPRFFYSKGAFLVLLWLVLQTAAWWTFTCLYYSILQSFESYNALAHFGLFLVGAPLAGWLADARYGNYKVFKTGAFVTFLASVLLCVYVLVTSNGQFQANANHAELFDVHYPNHWCCYLYSYGSAPGTGSDARCLCR